QLHGQAGLAPLGDEGAEQRELALIGEIDHAARRPHLEVIELLTELVRQAPSRKPQLHVDAGLAGMKPLESGIAAGGTPRRGLAFDHQHTDPLAGEEIGGAGADDPGAQHNDVGMGAVHLAPALAHRAAPSNQLLRWNSLRVSMQSRFQERYSSTPAMPSSRPR